MRQFTHRHQPEHGQLNLPQCLPSDLDSALRNPPSLFVPLVIPLFSTDQVSLRLQSSPTPSERSTNPRPSGRVGVSRNVHIGVGELRVKARPQLRNTAPSMLSFSQKTKEKRASFLACLTSTLEETPIRSMSRHREYIHTLSRFFTRYI